MRYCKKCILPDTRPNLVLNKEGVCNACASSKTKSSIDWQARENLFKQVVQNAKAKKRDYDCLIPVSGGKDSTWQVVQCLKYGLKPLAVTWKTPARTEIGRKNLENLIRVGVDHIDVQVNPEVEKKFMLKAFKRFGSTAIPMHLAIFNIPIKIAEKFSIPLIIWGENSAFEYGGTEEEQKGFELDDAWLKKFGVTHGTTAKDWVDDGLTEQDLAIYQGPTSEELKRKGVLAVFLGYYFQWDPEKSLSVAAKHGFQKNKEARTGYYDYADIDDDFISIHHYLKWHKFGFTRLFDNLSIEIREGRMDRKFALETLLKSGDQKPKEDIEKFCHFAGIQTSDFDGICENFRNQEIWKEKNGKWMMPKFILPNWEWK